MRLGLKELGLEFSEAMGLSQKQSGEAVRALFEIIAENVGEGHEIVIPNFGKFVAKESKPRTGRNPKTGESMAIPAKRTPKFTAQKGFKDAVAFK